MKRERLASTAISSAGYDPVTQELEIEFRSGRIYRYRGVPSGVYEFLLRTGSKGGYVSRMIDGRFDYEEVTPQAPEQDLLAALEASVRDEKSSSRDDES